MRALDWLHSFFHSESTTMHLPCSGIVLENRNKIANNEDKVSVVMEATFHKITEDLSNVILFKFYVNPSWSSLHVN